MSAADRTARHHSYGYGADRRPVVINNIDGPIAIPVGDGNVIQQQSALGSGPIAQQQMDGSINLAESAIV